MRPIDADALVEQLSGKAKEMLGIAEQCKGQAINYYEGAKYGFAKAEIIANGLPTVDAVPVIRCKECKHYREGKVLSPQKFCFRLRGKGGEAIGYNFAEDDFCSYGERSEDATD
jgi:hypothetical protein